MRLLADYILDSDLCLPKGDAPLEINGPQGSFTLHLSNTSDEIQQPTGVLAARLLFEADSLQTAREKADDLLSAALNALSFTTGHPFSYNDLRQIIVWEPGLSMREMIRYHETPMKDRAQPLLQADFKQSVDHYLVVQAGEKQQTALRWFRLGLAADSLEDQFTYFWFALEISARLTKGTEKVPSKCQKCQSPLYCESCSTYPVHKKYEGEAIRDAICRHVEGNGEEVFKTLQKIRNTLLHGDRISSVIDSLPCTQEQAVNALGHITQSALMGIFTTPNENAPKKVMLAQSDDLTRKKLIVSMHAAVGMGGDIDNPSFEHIPNIQVSISYPDDESSNVS